MFWYRQIRKKQIATQQKRCCHEIYIFPRISFGNIFRKQLLSSKLESDFIKLLNEEDSEIYRHHAEYNYKHIVIYPKRDPDSYCYIVYKRKNRKWLPGIRIDYISNTKIFRSYLLYPIEMKGIEHF